MVRKKEWGFICGIILMDIGNDAPQSPRGIMDNAIAPTQGDEMDAKHWNTWYKG